jgi:hypothetical protein
MPKLRKPFGRNAALARPDLDRITGHKPDRHKGNEHQRHKCGHGQSQSPKKISEHKNPDVKTISHLHNPYRVGKRRKQMMGAKAPIIIMTITDGYLMSTPMNLWPPSGLCL